MKKFDYPEIEISKFNVVDVITTSVLEDNDDNGTSWG